MRACASASGGVIFIPDNVNRKKCKASNDNADAVEALEESWPE